jgi:hypothetical protein
MATGCRAPRPATTSLQAAEGATLPACHSAPTQPLAKPQETKTVGQWLGTHKGPSHAISPLSPPARLPPLLTGTVVRFSLSVSLSRTTYDVDYSKFLIGINPSNPQIARRRGTPSNCDENPEKGARQRWFTCNKSIPRLFILYQNLQTVPTMKEWCSMNSMNRIGSYSSFKGDVLPLSLNSKDLYYFIFHRIIGLLFIIHTKFFRPKGAKCI